MRAAKEYLDSTSFRQCCWEILAFRVMREAAETAMGLIIWGQLSCNLVEMCRFPTTLARIHALHEATTPAYRDHYEDVEDLDEGEDRVSTAVWAQKAPGAGQGRAGSQSRCDVEPCSFCPRQRRRTCYHCDAGLCRAHARSRYRFSLYLTAALCPPCASQMTASSESEESDETTSAESKRAEGEEQREQSAQGGVTVSDPLLEEMDLQVSFDTADPILASLSESQARARGMDAEAWGDREFFLDGKAWRDGAFHPEDSPIPSTPHWSRWWRCESCKRWELDLERCSECRRWVCPMRCWPGNDTRCWDCIPNNPRLVPGRRSG